MTKPARHKTVRGRPQADSLPGIPDALPNKPPKAAEYEGLTLDEAIERAHAILDAVLTGATVRVKRVGAGLPKNLDPKPPKRPGPVWAEMTGPDGRVEPLPVGMRENGATRVVFAGGRAVVLPPDGGSVAVNGEALDAPAVLQPGDAVGIGGDTWTVNYWRKLPAPDPDKVFTLFSGGGDSSILAHLMRQRSATLVHVRTGISIPETWKYVQAVAADWGAELRAANPEVTYQDLVLGRVPLKTSRGKRPAGEPAWVGFPGPAGHYLMYQRLKESALAAFRSSVVGERGRSGQAVFLSGMRWGESDRRFRNAEEADHWGSVVWCSPLVWWTAGHMAEYRARYMCNDPHEHAFGRLCRPGVVPLSPVTEKLHMSGDCLCGAYAKAGELDEVAFWYPDVAAQIHALMDLARAEGIKRCEWGVGKQAGDDAEPMAAPGPLCAKCAPDVGDEVDLFDQWRRDGLITGGQYVALAGLTEVA